MESFVSRVTPFVPSDSPAYWFIFQADKLLVRRQGEGVDIPQARQADELGFGLARQHYLGHFARNGDAVHCYAAEIDADVALTEPWLADGLRQLAPQISDTLFALAGRAVQIVDWDRTHQFCGRCATPTEAMPHERAKKCPACGLTTYPRISPATITAVIRHSDEGNRILLARNHRFPAGRYSVLAGFVEPGESLEECVQREIMEEVGIRVQNIRYVASQPWPFPNSLMLGFTAEYASGELVLEEAEIDDARWFAADDLPSLPPKLSIARRLIDSFVTSETGSPARD